MIAREHSSGDRFASNFKKAPTQSYFSRPWLRIAFFAKRQPSRTDQKRKPHVEAEAACKSGSLM